MRLCIDIRVDAEGDRRFFARAHGALVEDFELGLGFDVEAVDAGLKGEIHLGRRLADT